MNSSPLSQSPEKLHEPSSPLKEKESFESSLPSTIDPVEAVTNATPTTTNTSPVPRTRTASHTSLLRKSTTASQPDKMLGLKASLALPKSTSSRSSSPAPSPVTSGEGQQRNGGHGHSHMHISLPKVRSKSGDGSKRVSSNTSVSSNGPISPPILAGTLSPAPSGNGTSSLKQLSSLLSGRSTPHHGAGTPSVTSPPTLHHHASNGSTAPTPTPGAHSATAISGLEASYVTKVGMALNDAVNKVFPSPATAISTAAAGYSTVMNDSALITYKGLCAPRVDRAREVGTMISQ